MNREEGGLDPQTRGDRFREPSNPCEASMPLCPEISAVLQSSDCERAMRLKRKSPPPASVSR